jgi:Flp pilus assembly protein TadD
MYPRFRFSHYHERSTIWHTKKVRKTRIIAVLAALLVVFAAGAVAWFHFKSRDIRVWVYTDYAFRFKHPDWTGVVESRFGEVNRMYQQNGVRVHWKVLDSSQIDPTSDAPGIDSRRATMALHVDRPTDIFVIFTGLEEGSRTGSVSPFTRFAVVVDAPQKSEVQNARLLANELAHLFGAAPDPASNPFSHQTAALIQTMRNYPLALGIDGLSRGSWEKDALAAIAQFDTVPHVNAKSHAQTVMGAAFINERRLDGAIPHLRLAVQEDPSNKIARLRLAQAYARNGQDELAVEQARELVNLSPEDPALHRALGLLLGRTHQPEAAVQELQTAIRQDPKNAENQMLLGIELASMFGRMDDAVAALETAASLDPESPSARRSLEKVQTLKQRVADEVERERGLVHDNPNNPDANYRLAKAEELAGDLKGAIRDFQKAAQLRPGNGTPHAELAALYLLTGDSGSAREEIRKARELGTEPPSSLIARLPPR